MISKEELNLIHKYLEGNLLPEEITVFKNIFETNPEFAKEVKRYTDLKIALKTASSLRIKTGKRAKIIQLSWSKLALAASLAFLIVAGGYFAWNSLHHPMHQKLYASYYVNPFEEPANVVTRSETRQTDPKALEMFSMAIHHMEQNDFNKAIDLFESIKLVKDERFMDEIDWYLALCYLRTGNKVKAADLFMHILNSNSVHSPAARSIYQELMAHKQ